jgi:translation initiation factor 3 subunit D
MESIWSTTGPVSVLSDADAQLVEALIPSEFRSAQFDFVRVCDFTRKTGGTGEAGDEFKTVVDNSTRIVGERKGRTAGAYAAGQMGTRGGRTYGRAAGEQTQGGQTRGGWGSYGQTGGGRGGGRQGGGGRGGTWTWQQQQQMQQQQEAGRTWSMEPQPEWTLVKELPLVGLSKLNMGGEAKLASEDVVWCGDLKEYDKQYEKIIARTGGRDLKKSADASFYNVTSSQDSVLEQLCGRAQAAAGEEKVVVGCSDKILAAFMTSARSVNPFDLVITKEDGSVMIDKRDFSSVEFMTVNETHATDAPPFDDSKDNADKLAQEATLINQWFSQMPLTANEPKNAPEMAYGNPFAAEEDEKTANVAYRYRKMQLGEKYVFVLRTEVNAITADGKFAALRALNEYNMKLSNWKAQLDAQRGALLASEIKNNSFKFGRWVAEATLAGCEQIKLGYVTRKGGMDNMFSLLNVQSLNTNEIAAQIGFSMNNAWAVVTSILDLIMQTPDQKARFILIKDPKKSALRLYQVPWETINFQEDEFADDIDQEDN